MPNDDQADREYWRNIANTETVDRAQQRETQRHDQAEERIDEQRQRQSQRM